VLRTRGKKEEWKERWTNERNLTVTPVYSLDRWLLPCS